MYERDRWNEREGLLRAFSSNHPACSFFFSSRSFARSCEKRHGERCEL